MVNHLDLSQELAIAIGAARAVAPGILAARAAGVRVERKDEDEPVTAADRAANATLVTTIGAAFPADAILSEEEADDGSRFSRDRVWMIDPIDGTKDFIAGRSGFATMIGLVIGDRPALGVVYQPDCDRLYYATRGGGCYVVEAGGAPERLAVSDVADLDRVRMVVSASHRDAVIDEVKQRIGCEDEESLGSVGLKLGLIARGRRDLYVNPQGHSKLWDVCAPEILLHEAGGKLTDRDGAPLDYRRTELRNLQGLIASNTILHDRVVARLASLWQR